MANVYSQINIHAVFSVKGRENILSEEIRNKVFPYISGILKNSGSYPLAVNGWTDHVHVFFEINLDLSLSKTMELVKSNSSKWVNDNNFFRGRFSWQRGYGGFSYSRSQRDSVIRYIMRQEKHHQVAGNSFKKEYMKILQDFEIEFQNEYLFEFYK
jgi:putative transposase